MACQIAFSSFEKALKWGEEEGELRCARVSNNQSVLHGNKDVARSYITYFV